jgi:hypothetical protein
MDTRSLTMKLEWWMKDFEPMRGATPSGMSAPSIAEMGGYRPHVSDSLGHHTADPVDFMPAIQVADGQAEQEEEGRLTPSR